MSVNSEIPIIPPQDDEFEFTPRPSFFRRVFCWTFDMAVVAVAGGLINYFILGIDPPETDVLPDAVLPATSSNIEFVSAAILAFLYFALMHGRFGRTLGKMIGRFGVVSMHGSRIGYGTAFVRAFWSVGILALIETPRLLFPDSGLDWLSDAGALYIIFNFIVFIWDQKYNRALHDRLAGTRTAMGRP